VTVVPLVGKLGVQNVRCYDDNVFGRVETDMTLTSLGSDFGAVKCKLQSLM
jgi:hypothetical protein